MGWDIRVGPQDGRGLGFITASYPHGLFWEASQYLMTAHSLHRNVDPPVWYDTDVKLFEIQRV